MVEIRRWEDIAALAGTLDDLSDGERRLVKACRSGRPCILGNGERPEWPDPERIVRAELLRYLILGGCKKRMMSEKGVRLRGAYITGSLDVSFTRTQGATSLRNCRFVESVSATQSYFESLDLTDLAVPTLEAQGMHVRGDALLERSSLENGILSGAVIGGDLNCAGAIVAGRPEDAAPDTTSSRKGALEASRLKVGGHLLLNNGFVARQKVNLAGQKLAASYDVMAEDSLVRRVTHFLCKALV